LKRGGKRVYDSLTRAIPKEKQIQARGNYLSFAGKGRRDGNQRKEGEMKMPAESKGPCRLESCVLRGEGDSPDGWRVFHNLSERVGGVKRGELLESMVG